MYCRVACCRCPAAETLTPQGIAAVIHMPSLALPAQPELALILDGVAGAPAMQVRCAYRAPADLALFAPGAVGALWR